MFPLGQIVATPQSIKEIEKNGQTPLHYVLRHQRGDWGDLSADDKKANNDALVHGDRILSAYVLANKVKVYVITEHDRSVTTMMCADEY